MGSGHLNALQSDASVPPSHDVLSWTAYYEDDYKTHLSKKQVSGFYPRGRGGYHDQGNVNGHLAIMNSSSSPSPSFYARLGLLTPEYGLNQTRVGNTIAAVKLISRCLSCRNNPEHDLHWMIPMNWCEVKECPKWEHKSEYDPGEMDWVFHPFHEEEINHTTRRKIIEIPNIRTNVQHVHHKHIPMN